MHYLCFVLHHDYGVCAPSVHKEELPLSDVRATGWKEGSMHCQMWTCLRFKFRGCTRIKPNFHKREAFVYGFVADMIFTVSRMNMICSFTCC
ncbi:hypothetical protein TNIN_346161 [Trichonephila inaurata madagascariensis]|uniref:Uncharacterized protein n=1 Tax=Trichonephila inaurata madagascariensis TaxID=2747483 RepID=A0A8X6YV98_9ARAC|nr:hypothetical protein TNIN_346161 [Trichonephila inaurata madagascariensis]